MQRWNKILKWFAAGGLGAVFLVILFTQIGTDARTNQPIAFNHKKHAQNRVTCEVCHPLYKDYPRAGIPGVKICIRCHEEVIHPMPEKDKIQEYRKSDREIPWVRVYRIKPDIYGLDRILSGIPNKVLDQVYGGKNPIYFSHRRHTAIGKVECKECHGDVATMEKPITQRLVRIEMDRCLSCHKAQEQRVSVDCADCHR
jgi:c(7)-type cytochrome triheme protein